MIEEHTNWDHAWPRIGAQRQRTRVLAWLEDTRLVTEHGEIMTIESLPDCAVKCQGMDVYMPSIQALPWYEDIIREGSVSCDANGKVIGGRIKGARGYIYLCHSGKWSRDRRGFSFLSYLRQVFTFVGAGAYLSASSLGLALWEQSYLCEGRKRIRKPSRALMDALEAGMVGGRVDFMADKQATYGYAHELDMSNAYATAARSLPVGTPLYFPEDTIESVDELLSYPVAYAKCYVTLTEPVPVGVVPIRGEQGENVRYMHEQGGTTAYLWKDEMDSAIKAGYHVYPLQAWAWEDMDGSASYWVDRMVWLRENAPSVEIAQIIKLMIVGAIGKQGMTGTTFELTTEETDLPLLDGWLPTDYFVKETHEHKRRGMKHWHSFIMARVRVWLYERMVAEMAAGNTVLATNYDAIYLTGKPRVTVDRLWKHRELTDVRFPYPRAIISKQKQQTPGIPASKRERQVSIGA